MAQTKPTLLFVKKTSVATPWFADIVNEYFNIQYYQPGTQYDPRSTILYVDSYYRPDVYDEFREKQFHIVIDNLWERKNDHASNYPGDTDSFVLQNVNWFWYNESRWYKHSNLDKYVPNRTHTHLALMPMNKTRPNRALLHKQMTPHLDKFIWSWVEQGRQLPNDKDLTNWENQRYFNPEWYDSTYFSLVSETYVEPIKDQPVFITEKTFKPLAFQHPFMIFGNAGTLAHLHELGFETYENLFNEKYDTQTLMYKRLQAIEINVRTFIQRPYDQLTLDKIKHNYNRFFDSKLVKQRVVDEIIQPILEYAETR